jgi:hypothetical protein
LKAYLRTYIDYERKLESIRAIKSRCGGAGMAWAALDWYMKLAAVGGELDR